MIDPSGRFRLFDATLFSGKPPLARHGLEDLRMVGPDIGGFRLDRSQPPEASAVNSFFEQLATQPAGFVLDFEAPEAIGSPAQADLRFAELRRVAKLFRRHTQGRTIGFYGDFPAPDYWRAIAPTSGEEHSSWRALNDRARVLEPVVDALFPSLYTFYPDRAGWVIYATAQVQEARRLADKPVYPFIWPEYHDDAEPIMRRAVEPDFWALQLDTLARIADGLVVWGGWDFASDRQRVWDPKAGWWTVTKSFARSLASS